MYHAPLRYGYGAGARYNHVDLDARVEGATPHQLVAILYEELLKSLDAMRAAHRQGERARMAPSQSRALSILQGLDAGLDHAKGGEVAGTLARIYREARRLVGGTGAADRGAELDRARTMIAEISVAWGAIG